MDTDSRRPAWPPNAEDLRRMYLDERLSAAKIAARYGLKYASPKTAESTVLYHLKRNGISRRDKSEHIRRVTEEMVDEWARRYEAGESLKDISANEFSPVTVFLHLKKRGVPLRDKVEAQIQKVTKHPKLVFPGDALEKAYLLGFTRGDLWATMHGRAVRVKGSSTHPGFIELFRESFGRFGPIHVYPREAKVTGYEWSMDGDLDSSFGFLLEKEKQEIDAIMADTNQFHSYLAGLFDAEGSIFYHKKGTGGAFELTITNMDVGLLTTIQEQFGKLGYSSKLDKTYRDNQKYQIRGADFIWRICVWRHDDVHRLLSNLPLRHPEKVAKKTIAMTLPSWPNREERAAILLLWQSLQDEIETEVQAFIGKAESSILASRSP